MPTINDQVIPYATSGRTPLPIVGGVVTVPPQTDDAVVVNLTGNVSSIVLRTPPVAYRTIDVLFVQDATGGRTVAWTTSVDWAASPPVIERAAGARTRVRLLWDNGAWSEETDGQEASSRAMTWLLHPEKLRRWRAALGDALTGTVKQPVITCVGDSVTAGQFAWNSVDLAEVNWVTGRTDGWVGQLRRMFTRDYGDAGEGFIAVPTSAVEQSFLEDRVTLTAGTLVACGPFGVGYAVANGQSITVLAPQCTSIDIFGLWRNGSNAAFTYTVDGGAPANGPTHSSPDLMYKHTITGLADTTHTLVINGPVTLRADIGGIVCRRGSSGVLVNRVGRGSQTSDYAVYNLLPAARNWVLSSTFTLQQTDLAIIMFRINEVATAYSTMTFRTNIKILTDWITAMGGCSLLVPDPVAATTETTTTFAQYRAQMIDIAETDDHVAFLDIDKFWGGPTWPGDTLGLRLENVHPNAKGHGDLARLIYRAITQAPEFV